MTAPIGIISSDLTGALDPAFMERPGDSTVLVSPSADVGAGNVSVVTNTQTVTPGEAYTTVRAAARRLRGYWLYKKVDSVLRGNIGPETRAVLDETGARTLVCQALPRAGRALVGGIGLFNGVPVHLTEYGVHPTVPSTESSLLAILTRSGIRTECVPLDVVRGGIERLRHVLATSDAEALAVDAVTEDDLRTIAGAVVADREAWFPCGSSGLAVHLAEALGLGSPRHCQWPLENHAAVLAVIGSRDSATVAQVKALAGHDDTLIAGIDARALCRGGPETHPREAAAQQALRAGRSTVVTTSLSPLVPSLHADVAPHLGVLAARIAAKSDATVLMVSGGHTGWCICDALGIRTLSILGQVEPGIACSRGIDRRGTDWTVLSKAGGFGDAHALVRLLAAERAQ